MNDQLVNWSKQFENYHLPRWEELPNIDYYMDQVIEYISKYVEIFCSDNSKMITPSMINNYVKLGLLPAPNKKKYSKNHIAMLLIITIIKQVTLISDIKNAIVFQTSIDGGANAYNRFCEEIEASLTQIYKIINLQKIEISTNVDKNNIALKSISLALVSKLLAVKSTTFSCIEELENEE